MKHAESRGIALLVNGLEAPYALNHSRFQITWRGELAQEATRVQTIVTTGSEELWRSPAVDGNSRRLIYDGPELMELTDYRVQLVSATYPDLTLAETIVNSGLLGRPIQASWIGRAFHHRDADAAAVARQTRPSTVADPARTWRTLYMEPVLQLRTTFSVEKPVISARFIVTACGIFTPYLNGHRLGDEELAPGWTDYEQRLFYQNHDVTPLISQGGNVLGVEVSPGWWSGSVGYDTEAPARHYGLRPSMAAELHIRYADGTVEVVTSDASWSESPGAIRFADLFAGEFHDLTCATADWLDPHYMEDPGWQPAEVADPYQGRVTAPDREPVKIVELIPAVQVQTGPDRTIVDFGQNFAGRVRLSLRGTTAGQLIRIRHGEVLDAEGSLYTENLRTVEATDTIVSAGEDFTFEPRFTFHGFRFVEIVGLRSELRLTDIHGVVLSSALRPTLTFASGSELVNRLMRNVEWSRVSNFVSVPTDCPQRDERLGWSADVQVFAPTASYLADSTSFLRSWLSDYSASQTSDGGLPDVAPKPPLTRNFDVASPGWGDAATVVPTVLHQFSGDRSILERYFPLMRRWVDYVDSANPSGLWKNNRGNDYGDWLSVDEDTSNALVATVYFYRSADLVARAARNLDQDEIASTYEALSGKIRGAFEREFVHESRLRHETQSGYALAIAFGLVRGEPLESFGRRLAELIEERGTRLTAGFLGLAVLGEALSLTGRSDLVYGLLLQEEYPSWGYSILQGATTIWERWDAWTAHAGFQTKEMNSFNHYSLGAIAEWIVARGAGIRQEDSSAGFASVLVAPEIDARLGSLDVTYESPIGPIRSAWQVSDDTVTMTVGIPNGSSAQIRYGALDVMVGGGMHSWSIPYERAEPTVAFAGMEKK